MNSIEKKYGISTKKVQAEGKRHFGSSMSRKDMRSFADIDKEMMQKLHDGEIKR